MRIPSSQAWQVAFIHNQEEEKLNIFEDIKRICDAMGDSGIIHTIATSMTMSLLRSSWL
jgi:SH3-like domain-containing protein